MQRHLHRAGLVIYAVLGIQHLELTGIAGPIGRGSDFGDVVVIHVYDTGAIRHFIGHCETNVDVVIAYPCFRIRREHLLQVFFAIHGDGIGGVLVRRYGDGRLGNAVPPDTVFIDVLCSREDFLTALLFCTGQ